MTKDKTSGSYSVVGSKIENKLPTNNWSQQAKAHNNFACQQKFLTSNFLFSFSTQKPLADEAMLARSMGIEVHNRRMHSHEVEKVWQVLSRLELSSKNYVKPGKSLPLAKSFSASASRDCGQTIRNPTSENKSTYQARVETHKIFSESSIRGGDYRSYGGASFTSSANGVEEDRKSLDRQTGMYTSVSNNSHPQSANGVPSNHAVRINDMGRSGNTYPDGTEDDNILELGFCPEASVHLQEMKDMLIGISNDLLDNITNLNADQIEKLRQERMQLNTQTQQLQKYLRAVSVNDERRASNFSASTATPAFQYETPPTVPFKINPTRLATEFYMDNEENGFDRWDSSSVSLSPVGMHGASAATLVREPYVPKYVDVTYIEGSNDKKYSSCDFPWTKKLENICQRFRLQPRWFCCEPPAFQQHIRNDANMTAQLFQLASFIAHAPLPKSRITASVGGGVGGTSSRGKR